MQALEDLQPEVRSIVRRVTERLLEQGAKAVLLTGSQARGRAEPDSDIDFFAIGDGPSQRQQCIDGRMVAVHWFTPQDVRRRLTSPGDALIAVDGWRNAIVLEDPTGVAEALCAEARDWKWDKIEREADAWVCDELAECAEYVAKLARALANARALDAAAFRAEVALRLARIGAVAWRLTSESENGFWETVARANGADWRQAVTEAFDPDGKGPSVTAAAVARVFDLLADHVDELLDEDQRAAIDHARHIVASTGTKPARSRP